MDLVWAKLEYTTGDSSVFDSKSAHVKGNNVQTLFVHRREYRVGRSAHSELRIADPLISNKHCIVLTKGEDAGKADKNGRHLKAYIRDMNSSNGTSVNNKLLQAGEERLLESGDVIRLGARVKNPFLPVIRYLAHPIASNQEEIKRFLKKPLENSPAKRRSSRGVLRVEANDKLQEANKVLRKELDESLKQLQDAKEDASKLKLELEKAALESKKFAEVKAERAKLHATIQKLEQKVNALKAKGVADMEAAREAQEEAKKQQRDQLAIVEEFKERLSEQTAKTLNLEKELTVRGKIVAELRRVLKREETVKGVLQKQVDQFIIDTKKYKEKVDQLTLQKETAAKELDATAQKLKTTEESLAIAERELMNAKQFAQNTSGRHETQAKRLQLELSETRNEKSVMREKINWIGKNVLAIIQTRNQVMQDLAVLNQRLDDVAKQTVDKTQNPDMEEKNVAATQAQTAGTQSKADGPGAPNSTLDAYESDAEATQQTTIAEAPTARKRPRLDRVQEEEEDDLQNTQLSTPASNGSTKNNASSTKEKRQRTESKASAAETVVSPGSAK